MSCLELLVALGLALLVAGTLAPIAHRALTAAIALQAAGIALLGLGGALVLFGAPTFGASFRSSLHPALGIDGLTGFFLATLALVGAAALVYSRGYLAGVAHSRALIALGGLFLIALVGVVMARDPSSFLACWELMTLVPATAILVRRSDATVRRAVYVYLAVTHLGGAGVWICVLALAHYGALGNPAALAAQGAGVQAFVIAAAIVGFGTKAGLMPLHSWLPRAHPVAPSHISALMSGVMIKVALYGLIRVLFEWVAPAPLWAGLVVLGLGLLSALGGVLYALVQHDLKRLLAFHSIENVGHRRARPRRLDPLRRLRAMRPGRRSPSPRRSFTSSTTPCSRRCCSSAPAPSSARSGSLDLDRLGGLLRRMPWTGGAFLVGSMAIAGVPPLNGFASEWLTLQSLLHVALGPGRSGSASPAPSPRPASPRRRRSPSSASSRWSAWCCWARRAGRRPRRRSRRRRACGPAPVVPGRLLRRARRRSRPARSRR